MKTDELKQLTTDALDKLARCSTRTQRSAHALLKTMGRFHRYSWHNVTLIASQCPTATASQDSHVAHDGPLRRKARRHRDPRSIVGRRSDAA